MSDIAIRVEGLSKQFRIGSAERYRTLRDSLTDAMAAPFRLLRNGRSPKAPVETIWALKDISFDVKRGEVIGIIGRNGAGKSTLLKILSRITEPTHGHAEIHGRVGSLLEVGTGFHPELTGRENIFLNGAILGMKRAEILRKFDEIVAFAEVEKFIDTPVKHYSSGMYMRLAFAVAAHLEPEVLIVDEVLAVGDAAFQKKCLGKMGDVAKHGRTVLFVSHNMGAVRQLCQRCLLLRGGKLVIDDSTSQCLGEYFGRALDSEPRGLRTDLRIRNGEAVEILDAHLSKDGVPVSTALYGDVLDLSIEILVRSDCEFSLELQLRQAEGIPLAFAASGLAHGIDHRLPLGRHTLKVILPPLELSDGTYHIDLGLAKTGVNFFDHLESGLTFSILPAPIGPKNWYFAGAAAPFFWDVEFQPVSEEVIAK